MTDIHEKTTTERVGDQLEAISNQIEVMTRDVANATVVVLRHRDALIDIHYAALAPGDMTPVQRLALVANIAQKALTQ